MELPYHLNFQYTYLLQTLMNIIFIYNVICAMFKVQLGIMTALKK
jgi:hypothetical protein